MVNPSSIASTPRFDAFRQSLQGHGWVEGQNLTIEYRFGENRVERLPELADELVRLRSRSS